MTTKEFYNEIINLNLSTDMTEKAKTLLLSLEKKVSKASEKKNAENAALAESVYSILKGNGMMRCGEIAEAIGLSIPKVCTLLSLLGDRVVKVTNKRISYYMAK